MNERTKAERLLHPQCPEDYAVTLTAAEAREVPELRPWIEAIEAAHAADQAAAAILRATGRNARATLDRIVLDSMGVKP